MALVDRNENNSRAVFKLVYGPGCQTKIADFVIIYRILALMFSLYFNFNINALAYIWQAIHLSILLPPIPLKFIVVDLANDWLIHLEELLTDR